MLGLQNQHGKYDRTELPRIFVLFSFALCTFGLYNAEYVEYDQCYLSALGTVLHIGHFNFCVYKNDIVELKQPQVQQI